MNDPHPLTVPRPPPLDGQTLLHPVTTIPDTVYLDYIPFRTAPFSFVGYSVNRQFRVTQIYVVLEVDGTLFGGPRVNSAQGTEIVRAMLTRSIVKSVRCLEKFQPFDDTI